MLEAMLRNIAEERGLHVEVSSAGFLYDGEAVSPTMSEVMIERGFDPAPHRSRIVNAEIVKAADLVLTMERSHARRLVLASPESASRIHTLGSFAYGLDGLSSASGPHSIVEAVAATRSDSALLGSGPDEISDPHGRHRRVHRETADQLNRLANAVLDGLFQT